MPSSKSSLYFCFQHAIDAVTMQFINLTATNE